MSKNILHMLTPLKHMSPFDVNMAADAGYDTIATYTSVTPEEVRGLTQDAIFSRSPSDAVRTGLFFAGKNAIAALDMMKAAEESLVPPFLINLFADPAGSFTTAAGMVACAAKLLETRFQTTFRVKRVVIYGGTGVVAFSAAVIAAQEGARVRLVGYDGTRRVAAIAADMKARFGVDVEPADGSSPDRRASRSSARPRWRPRRTSWSPATSTPCRRPASTASTCSPTASHWRPATASRSARSPSATSSTRRSTGCSGA